MKKILYLFLMLSALRQSTTVFAGASDRFVAFMLYEDDQKMKKGAFNSLMGALDKRKKVMGDFDKYLLLKKSELVTSPSLLKKLVAEDSYDRIEAILAKNYSFFSHL